MGIYEILAYFFVYGVLGWCVEVAFAAVKEGWKIKNTDSKNGGNIMRIESSYNSDLSEAQIKAMKRSAGWAARTQANSAGSLFP